MEIDELLEQACEITCLPSTAKDQIPGGLTNETKRRIKKIAVDELAGVLKKAVDQIDHGSVESIEKLVRKAAKR
ncbi:hypothetical protein ACTQ56_08950 [[Clostridium] aminophilum]|uniref:hypothetical protein n=1 Tax=[Clostridium] aminophilum TaxID=1526 RepID=UPI003F9DA723